MGAFKGKQTQQIISETNPFGIKIFIGEM